MADLLCDRCGRNMTYQESTYAAFSIDIPDTEAMRAIYPELTQARRFFFCYVCQLNSNGLVVSGSSEPPEVEVIL